MAYNYSNPVKVYKWTIQQSNKWDVGRSFKLTKVLESLQAYKIKSGQISGHDIALLCDKLQIEPDKLKDIV